MFLVYTLRGVAFGAIWGLMVFGWFWVCGFDCSFVSLVLLLSVLRYVVLCLAGCYALFWILDLCVYTRRVFNWFGWGCYSFVFGLCRLLSFLRFGFWV